MSKTNKKAVVQHQFRVCGHELKHLWPKLGYVTECRVKKEKVGVVINNVLNTKLVCLKSK